MNDRFPSLLEPVNPELFWERYWGKEHLHLQTGQGSRFDSVLRLEDLDVLLQSDHLSVAFLNVVTNGQRHPVEEWSRIRESARGNDRVVDVQRLLELYSKGATIILNQAHHAIPRLSAACRQLAGEVGFRTQANVYLTPPDARGFPFHTDDHEVVVLQILGRKSWRVSPAGVDAPIEIELLAGDLLYIPRGLAHEAVSRDAASIHVTLGFSPVYAYQLLEELASKARSHPAFQQALPPPDGNARREKFETEFAQSVRELVAESTVSELSDRRFQTLIRDQIQGWPGRLSDVLALGGLTLETVVCARSGILHTVGKMGKSIEVEFAGQKVAVPVFMQSCLERILSREPFAIKELRGMITDSGKVEIVKRFLQTGFLSIVRP